MIPSTDPLRHFSFLLTIFYAGDDDDCCYGDDDDDDDCHDDDDDDDETRKMKPLTGPLRPAGSLFW